jgi:hypothetical protein
MARRGGDLVAGGDAGGGAQVFNAAVGAGADEDAVDGDFFERRAGLEAHVFEGALEALAVCSLARRRGRARWP